ncbi:hypothetical protein GQ42DRAFT_152456 [Ramicandelaber brevisporus]|nr:hypothetical protein GQ42DRAFT_152456 [Ramicandelaber brevisporus]
MHLQLTALFAIILAAITVISAATPSKSSSSTSSKSAKPNKPVPHGSVKKPYGAAMLFDTFDTNSLDDLDDSPSSSSSSPVAVIPNAPAKFDWVAPPTTFQMAATRPLSVQFVETGAPLRPTPVTVTSTMVMVSISTMTSTTTSIATTTVATPTTLFTTAPATVAAATATNLAMPPILAVKPNHQNEVLGQKGTAAAAAGAYDTDTPAYSPPHKDHKMYDAAPPPPPPPPMPTGYQAQPYSPANAMAQIHPAPVLAGLAPSQFPPASTSPGLPLSPQPTDAAGFPLGRPTSGPAHIPPLDIGTRDSGNTATGSVTPPMMKLCPMPSLASVMNGISIPSFESLTARERDRNGILMVPFTAPTELRLVTLSGQQTSQLKQRQQQHRIQRSSKSKKAAKSTVKSKQHKQQQQQQQQKQMMVYRRSEKSLVRAWSTLQRHQRHRRHQRQQQQQQSSPRQVWTATLNLSFSVDEHLRGRFPAFMVVAFGDKQDPLGLLHTVPADEALNSNSGHEGYSVRTSFTFAMDAAKLAQYKTIELVVVAPVLASDPSNGSGGGGGCPDSSTSPRVEGWAFDHQPFSVVP